jgi:hypothetical protein
LGTLASKPATPAMANLAKASIQAQGDFKDAKFDDTLNAFAGDVADRANRIRADANREGEDIGLDEARQQAIAELKPFVKKTMVGQHEIAGYKFGGEERYSYQRASSSPEVTNKPKTPAGANAETDALDVKLVQAGLRDFSIADGKVVAKNGGLVTVSNKTQRDALPLGTVYIGPDGKQWTKQ